MNEWAVVVASAVGGIIGGTIGLAGTYLAHRLQTRAERRRQQAGAASALLGGAQLLLLQCGFFATERSLRDPLSPLRPRARRLMRILGHRFDQIGTAHAQLSLVASEDVIKSANEVLDVCGVIGRLVDVSPQHADWEAALNDLARTTLELKNVLRTEDKLDRLIPPPHK